MTILGVEVKYQVAADVPFTTNIVPATVGLLSPLAALQSQHFRAWIPISVGATGGVRLLPVVPVGATVHNLTLRVNNTVAPSTTPTIPAINVASTNALANAGTHFLEIEGTITNGAVAGSIDLQLAQNSSDALTMTVLRGGWMEVTKF